MDENENENEEDGAGRTRKGLVKRRRENRERRSGERGEGKEGSGRPVTEEEQEGPQERSKRGSPRRGAGDARDRE